MNQKTSICSRRHSRTRTALRRVRDPRGGNVIVLFVLVLSVLFGVGAMMLDGGRIYWEKRRSQNAADAAAMAGGHEMRRGRDLTDATVIGYIQDDAELYGYIPSEIAINYPPTIGGYAGNNGFVEAIVTRDVPLTFMQFFGRNSARVAARATAGLRPSGDACVIALDPDDSKAFWANGNPTFSAACGIMVNSNAGDALSTSGNGACITATYIGVAGGASAGCVSPTPVVSVPPMIDPLALFNPPSSAGMSNGYTTTQAAATSGAFAATFAAKGGNGNGNGGNGGGGGETVKVWWPGYYPDEIKIQNGTHVFMPGEYVLDSGIKITGGNVSGTEVFFYNQNLLSPA